METIEYDEEMDDIKSYIPHKSNLKSAHNQTYSYLSKTSNNPKSHSIQNNSYQAIPVK